MARLDLVALQQRLAQQPGADALDPSYAAIVSRPVCAVRTVASALQRLKALGS
jgi:hypothetical protein